MSTHPKAPQTSDGSELTSIARGRAWKWLHEIRERLHVVVEVLDERGNPLLSPVATRAGTTVRRLVRPCDGSLRLAIVRAMQELTQERVTVGGISFTCTPILGSIGAAIGVLLVADEAVETPEEWPGAGELERTGSWLAAAIETHLVNAPVDEPRGLRQLSSLYRLLGEAAASGSEHEILRTFVEAIAVWEDAESWGYLHRLDGRYALEVSLPGSATEAAPPFFDSDPIPVGLTMLRTPQGALAFGDVDEVLLLRAQGTGSSQWVVAVAVARDAVRDARLSFYCDVLNQFLGKVVAVQSSRLTWAMVQPLLDYSESPELASERSLQELGKTLSASACFTVFRRDGFRAVAVGDVDRILASPSPVESAHLLISRVTVAHPYVGLVGVARSEDCPFTRRDQHLLEIGIFTLGAWLPPVLRRIEVSSERRGRMRAFDELLERHVERAAAERDVSVLVIDVAEAALYPTLSKAWIAAIRGQLRPTDLAGRLTSGDLCVLLLDTPGQGAHVVANRLRRLMRSGPDLPPLANVSIGVATHVGGAPYTESIIDEARASLHVDRTH